MNAANYVLMMMVVVGLLMQWRVRDDRSLQLAWMQVTMTAAVGLLVVVAVSA